MPSALEPPPFSDLLVDRYLADELPPPERAAFEERCRAEPALQARVDELRASRRAFSTSAPSFEAIAARAAAERPWWERLAHGMQLRLAVVGAAAAAVLVLVVVVDPDETTRTKGQRFLDFVVERDGAVLPGGPGMKLHPGDRVQFVVDAGAGAYVAVWSRDGAGAFTRYAPAIGAPVRAQGRHAFDNSTRLDDVLGDETFIGVRCDLEVGSAELGEATVEAAVRGGAPPKGCALDRVVVHKVARP